MGTQVYPDPKSQIPASFEKSLELAVKMLFEVVTSPTANAMLSGLAGALALAGVKNSCAVPLSVSALHQESVKLPVKLFIYVDPLHIKLPLHRVHCDCFNVLCRMAEPPLLPTSVIV